MGVTITAAQVSTGRSYSTLFFRYQLPSNFTPKGKQSPFRVRCALFPKERRESRRLVSGSLLICLYCTISIPKHAVAGAFDKYMKRKKLDPLEAYVPAIILTQLQIEDDVGPIVDS